MIPLTWKRALAGLMLLLMLFGLAACGSSSPTGESPSSGASEAEKQPAGAAPETAAPQPPQPKENGMYMTQTERVGVCTNTDKKGYGDFSDFLALAGPFAITPGFNEKLVSQGMDRSEETGNIYISGYFKRTEDNPFTLGENPTTVAVLNAEGEFIAEYVMYKADGSAFTSHMGGVAVSEDTLYVSADQGEDGDGDTTYWIAAIPLEELVTEGHQKVTIHTLYQVPVQPSFLNYSNGTLWVGNFYLSSKAAYAPPVDLGTTKGEGETFGAYVLGYDLSEKGAGRMETLDGELYAMPDADKFYAVTNRIQGMTMLADGSIVLSRSYGRKNNSELLAYDPSQAPVQIVSLNGREYDCVLLEESCQLFAYTMMPMSEGITVRSAEGGEELLILYESGAAIYDGDGTYDRETGIYRTDYVWRFPIGG